MKLQKQIKVPREVEKDTIADKAKKRYSQSKIYDCVTKTTSKFQFKLIRNDQHPTTLKKLADYKNLVSKQLPKMPRTYITKIVFDGCHECLVVLREDRIIGGACFRCFSKQSFAELVFMCVDHEFKGKGLGSSLIDQLKEQLQVKNVSKLLTYADDFALGFFRKQAFEQVVSTVDQEWKGYIKAYEGGKLMQCQIDKQFKYTYFREIVKLQKNSVMKKIKQINQNNKYYSVETFKKIHKRQSKIAKKDKELTLNQIPGCLDNGWSQQNQQFLQNEPEFSLILEQLYAIECFRKLPFFKIVKKLDQNGQLFTTIDFETIEKKIISNCYFKNLGEFKKDLKEYMNDLRSQVEEKRLEEFEKKIDEIVTFLNQRKLSIPPLDHYFKENKPKRASKSSKRK